MNSICNDLQFNETQKSVGKLLKQARQKHKVRDLNIIARDLCIKTHLLEALEQNDFGSFASSCYAIGFLKNYSNYLNLDTSDMIARYEHEYEGSKECFVLAFPEAEKHNDLSIKSIAGVATLCIVILGGVWGSFNNLDAEEILIPIGQIGKLLTNKQIASTPKQQPLTIAAVEKTVNQTPVTIEYPQAKTPETTANRGVIIGAGDVRLQAREDVWVRISKEDGTIVVEKILEKGEDFITPNSQGLNLMTNNAAALAVFVGSKALKALGGEGEILEGLVLEQEKLLHTALLD